MQSINLILYFSFKKLQLDTIFDASSYVSTNSPTVQPVWSKRDFNSFCKVSISHSLWIYWTIYTQFEKHATWIIKFGLMTDLLIGANLVCVFALFIWEIFFDIRPPRYIICDFGRDFNIKSWILIFAVLSRGLYHITYLKSNLLGNYKPNYLTIIMTATNDVWKCVIE